MIRLSVIIVNYNVRYFLDQAIRACLRACSDITAEIIIIDNNSQDDSVAYLREQFSAQPLPNVALHIIANTENTGFSKANNQGIAIAKGEYILLLNPDTVVAEDTFTKCLAYMDAHPETGGMGVRMLDGTGRFLAESKRAFPSPEVAFYKAFGLANIFPHSQVFGKYHLGYLDARTTHQVEVLAGAYMLIRKKVLDQIGDLDETFFMYGEDIDLSYRIVQGGHTNVYFADAPIIHYKGESTKKASFNYVRMFYHAMKIFARKHFSGPRAGALIFLLNMAIYLRAAIAAVVRMLGKMATPIFDALLLFGGAFIVKLYWEYYVKYIEGGTYPDTYLYINVPVYILLWIFLLFLSGGYDATATTRRLVRGMVWGTIAIAAVYGFFPEYLRFSRGMIIASAAVNTSLLIAGRAVLHFVRHGNFRIGEAPVKKILIVGNTTEAQRTHQLLNNMQLGNQVIGYIRADDKNCTHPLELGNLAQIASLIPLYRANEVIFCAADMRYQTIITLMDELRGKSDFKIVSENGNSIIGSNSRDTAGDIYTMDVQLQILQPQNKRSKRSLDVLAAICGLILSPLLIWFVTRKGGFIANCFSVLSGAKSWVGYYPGAAASHNGQTLPMLKPGVLNPTTGAASDQLRPQVAERINFMYARDYSSSADLQLIRQQFRHLGD